MLKNQELQAQDEEEMVRRLAEMSHSNSKIVATLAQEQEPTHVPASTRPIPSHESQNNWMK